MSRKITRTREGIIIIIEIDQDRRGEITPKSYQ